VERRQRLSRSRDFDAVYRQGRSVSTRTLTLVPNPRDKVHSAAAVNPFGTVYFEESGSRCGSNATVEVYPIGGPMITAGTLRPGIDMFHPFVFEHGSIVEEGTPGELARRAGRFAALLELEAAGWDWRSGP
jgi:hypothetical protein